MLKVLTARAQDQKGFTLIELLVVILIIGILAAIALPAFLGQKTKGQDSSAKSDARNAVSAMESCFATTQDYNDSSCDLSGSGLTVGAKGAVPPKGQVAIESATTTTYKVTAKSQSGNTFSITRTAGGTASRSCADVTSGKGGCNGTSW